MLGVVRRLAALAVLTGMLTATSSSRAVILYSSAERNTSAPTGAFANSGWQWQGQWAGGFLGTVIAKKFFITADHIGGAIGDNFIINGEIHRTVKVWGDPDSDLRIYQTVGSFLNVAPLFKDSTEVGRSVMIFGRGTQRGDPVIVDNQLKGWKWGASDAVQSWGRNAIVGIATGGPSDSQLLRMNFDANGTTYECTLSGGDSGGGVFVKHGAYWKLAGINYSVDGPFSDGVDTFDAAIFDRSGLGTGGTPSGSPVPSSLYATRISARLSWISGVLSGKIEPGTHPHTMSYAPVPEPATAAAILLIGALALRRRAR